MENIYLFFGDYKYWLMTDYHDVDPHYDEDDYVINRARPSRTLPPLRHYARGRLGAGQKTWTARTTCKRLYEVTNSWPYVWHSNFKQHARLLHRCR